MEVPTVYLVKVRSLSGATTFYKLCLSQETVNCLLNSSWKASEIFCHKIQSLLLTECTFYNQVHQPLPVDASPAFEIVQADVEQAMRAIELEQRLNCVWYYRWKDQGQYLYGFAKKTPKASAFNHTLAAGKWRHPGTLQDFVYSFFMEEIEPAAPDPYYQGRVIEIPSELLFSSKFL